jgi:hypothetical protein
VHMLRTILLVALATGLMTRVCKSLDQYHRCRQNAALQDSLKTWEGEGGNIQPAKTSTAA